jgi:hypothetical protein
MYFECRIYFVTLLACAALLASPLAQADPAMTIGDDRVVVTGITPGGEAILFGRSIAYQGGVPVLARHAATGRDDDNDGAVTWLFEEMQERSTWVAVDLDSGAHTTGWRSKWAPRVITLSPEEWGEEDQAVDLSRAYLDFLLVRPRKGAWASAILQGSSSDADGRVDNNLRMRTSSMTPLHGKESPPPHAVKKDVLVIIDSYTLDVAVVTAQ